MFKGINWMQDMIQEMRSDINPENNESIKKKLKVLTAITEIHESIGANLELEKVADILVKKLVKIMHCDGCAILLKENHSIRVMAEHGLDKHFKKEMPDLDSPIIKNIINNKKSIFIRNRTTDEMRGCLPSGCEMNSLICTPVIVHNDVKGIIYIDSKKPNAFTKEDLEFVELLSTQIAIAFERALMFEHTKSLSIIDPLTSCYNRRKLDEDIMHEINRAKRYGRRFSVLMIDIDWFKNYNDFHGHLKGDNLLKRLSFLLVRNIRGADRVYRYGGEEFVILLPELGKRDAFIVAEKLRKIIENEAFDGEYRSQPNKSITISIGIATFPEDGKTKEELLSIADSALYRAKDSGKNRVIAYDRVS